MESTPEIVFEDKKSFPDDQEGISLSPDLSITKTELFNVDMAYYLKGQPIGAPAKKVITAMSKGKSKGNQWDVNYVLGRKIKNEFTGRMIAKRSIGLQGLEHDIRGALARDYYWDLDIANCQVELLRQMAVKHGWVSTEITSYCNNREEKLQQLCLETKEERWEMKVRFIRLLFGGNRRVDDPKWLFDRFYPEVNKLMKNIAGVYPDIYKSCLKTKKDNPYGACCAHVLQTEERGCLLSFDQYLTKMGRSMDVLIHDGGYVRKVGDEKKFPEDLLRGGEEYIKKLTGYQVKLVQKAIETTFTLPNAVEVEEGESYWDKKAQFESVNFRCSTSGEKCYFDHRDPDRLIVRTKSNLWDVFANIKYSDVHKGEVKKFDFIKRWTKDEDIRCYSKVRMVVPPDVCPDDCFNTWNGFKITRTPSPVLTEEINSKVESINYLIRRLCNHDEKKDGEDPVYRLCYEYVLNYIADMFQNPGVKPNVAIVFKAIEGAGKGVLFQILEAMLGSKHALCTKDVEREFLGHFNSSLTNRFLIGLDEINAKTGNEYDDVIKGLITEEVTVVNGKHQGSIEERNYRRVFFFTNKPFVLRVTRSDRRFMAVESYFQRLNLTQRKLYGSIIKNPEILRAWYDQLMTRDINGVDLIEDRPQTDFFKDMMSNTVSPVERFIAWKIISTGRCFEIESSDLLEAFHSWLDNNYSKKREAHLTNTNKLGVCLKSLGIPGFTKSFSNGVTSYHFSYGTETKQWLADNYYLDESEFTLLI